MNILLSSDSYKTSQHKQLPPNTTKMYGNCTLRSFKYLEGCELAVNFGTQMVLKWLNEEFDKFFADPNSVQEAKEILSAHLGFDYDASHFQELWDLQYLPLEFKALPEGSCVPEKIPVLTFTNTHPNFAWLPLFLETPISNMLWKPITSATISRMFRQNVNEWVSKTDKGSPMAEFMVHDFSSRGMSSIQSSMNSGMGFLTSSMGTDNLPAIIGAKKFYNEPVCGFSVSASEHSTSAACIGVMGEQEMVNYFLDQFPDNIYSMVSDTLDLTKMVKPEKGGYLFELKDRIMKRDGKIVIRPDSSPTPLTPVEMVCGYDGELTERMLVADYPEFYKKGLIECLWDIFGGSINEQGYKVLSPSIGAIYGEAITLDRQVNIYKKLADKGFAATNILMGCGSYQLNTNSRDTLSLALKGTYCEVDGKGIDIYKDPVTDNGTKKSAKGLLRVDIIDGEYVLKDQCTKEEEAGGELQTIFENGKILKETTLSEIRDRIRSFDK